MRKRIRLYMGGESKEPTPETETPTPPVDPAPPAETPAV
jgi:hypothetical protein